MNLNNPVSKKPKISIITVCYNSERTIADTLVSINSQDYANIEHVIIDGLSRDNTIKIINQHKTNKQIIYSEKDSGIYDAMNKGINQSTGDIVGFLNADDKLSDSTVISTIAENFINTNTDAVYGDLIYFKNPDQADQAGQQDKIIRYFKSRAFKNGLFAKGWCPPHPTFYVKKSVYLQYGGFDLSLKMGNDVALMMRLLEIANIKTHYIPKVLVHMRVGGVSNQSARNIWTQNTEIIKAAQKMGVKIPILLFILHKLFNRATQFVIKPS